MRRAILVLSLAPLMAVLVGCAKVKPEPGTWAGDSISFNVSADGSNLTTTDSSLPENCSLLIYIDLEPNALGMSRTTRYIYDDIPVGGGGFEYTSDELIIVGTFSSPTEASGTFRLIEQVQDHSSFASRTETVSGSGAWSATH